MHETWWLAAFVIFIVGLPLSAAHAIIAVARRRAGREDSPRWLTALRWVANLAIIVGFVALSAFIVARWREGGYPPFSNMVESLSWMAWGLCLVYFVSRGFVHFPGLEAAACLGVVAILATTSAFPMAPRPLMPALRSNWLVFHVLTCMVSYGAFFAAFLMAILWLAAWRKREAGSVVDALSYQTMAFGFLLLTVGIVSGAIWARQAWGRYWGWDPKETWSLITWFVYGIYLHYRLIKGGKGAAAERLPLLNSIFAIAGFGATLFTYFGVNFLLPSLHSYAKP